MQTIKLQLEDSVYQNFVKSGIDIQSKFKEFLADFVDDGYPAITTDEAKRRVAKAVKSHQNGTMKTVSHEDLWDQMDSYVEEKIENCL